MFNKVDRYNRKYEKSKYLVVFHSEKFKSKSIHENKNWFGWWFTFIENVNYA